MSTPPPTHADIALVAWLIYKSYADDPNRTPSADAIWFRAVNLIRDGHGDDWEHWNASYGPP